MAKVLSAAELLGNTARLNTILLAAGAHTAWTETKVRAHMKREMAKHRPNLLYYIAKTLPPYGEPNLGVRMDYAMMTMFLGSFIASVLCLVAAGGLRIFGSHWSHGTAVVALSFLWVFVAIFLSLDRLEKVTMRGPATWTTQAFDEAQEAEAPEDVRAVARAIPEFISGARLEISLLFQGEWKLDPVLWAVVTTDTGDIRIPLRVWDEHGSPILPH